MSFADLLRTDLATRLCCPACGARPLVWDGGDEARCDACGATYPVDAELGFAGFLAPLSDTGEKARIQVWWGDLYRQLYAGHEDGVDGAALEAELRQVEDLFRQRRHLCTEEMPLSDLAGREVLEIGPGGGAHSAIFKLHDGSVTAVDITPERAMATGRKLALIDGGGGRAYQADAENLPFADDSFDVVYSNGVLHHSADTGRCLAEARRVLKPGGRAVLMLYARHSAVYWLNILPRGLIGGEMFRWPEAEWIGRVTEGKPRHGTTRNPYTRVYSETQIRDALGAFRVVSLRKSSFQFDNAAIPRLTEIRRRMLTGLGFKPHPGARLIYGDTPFVPDTAIERWLGKAIGFAWNIVAEKI